jgi:hypothetical protein
MAKRASTVKEALKELRLAIRSPSSEEPLGDWRSGEVPEDLQTQPGQWLRLSGVEFRAFEAVRPLLCDDLRFEHMEDSAMTDAMWRFACLCELQPDGDHVAGFVAVHAIEPTDHICFFPVESLTVAAEVEMFGVQFLRADAVDVPASPFWPDPKATMGSAIAVACRGTNYNRMRERARPVAEHALRLLRVSLRQHMVIHERQLRFRLGEFAWFDNRINGWELHPERAWPVELNADLVELVASQAISTLTQVPNTDVERRANLALAWIERAQLAIDPMVELLYLFFALEAMLGDKAERLKGASLALRRATLGAVMRDQFRHPLQTFALYEEVRSAAVHGEQPPAELTDKEVSAFAWDVRHCVNEFVEYAHDQGFTKRAQVRKALDAHEKRALLIDGLRSSDPKNWDKYFGIH